MIIIIVFIVGMIFGAFIVSLFLLGKEDKIWKLELKNLDLNNSYIKACQNNSFLGRENNELKNLVMDAFTLIDLEYTFRRHSDVWMFFKGVETRNKLKKYLIDEGLIE
jgi:hypothetical protein